MVNGIRTGDPRNFNKGRSSKFREGSRVRQTPEEGRRTYRPKRYGSNNKDEDNSPKTLNEKNQQASSQKFRQQIFYGCLEHCLKRDILSVTVIFVGNWIGDLFQILHVVVCLSLGKT